MSERSPGTWRLRVYIGDDPVTGRPLQATRTVKGSKRQAQSALAGFVTECTNGLTPVIGSTTVSAYLDQWITHIAASRSPTTVRGYRDKARRINAKVGRVQLAKLSAQTLDRAYREWLEEGLSANTVHHLHGVLSAALHQAAKWGTVAQVATDRTSPPPLRTKAPTIPTPEVIQRLIAAAEERGQPILAAAIAVACTTGLRRGELLGLQWGDVDLDARVLRVRRSVKHADGPGWVVGPPKTHQERVVALDDFSLLVLQGLRVRADQWAADAGVADGGVAGHAGGAAAERFVLTFDLSGREPMKPDSLSQAFGRLCRLEGVSGVNLHTLRHFSASVLIASGRDVRTVAGRLGHADASTTLRVYAHMVQGRDREAADFLGQLMMAGDVGTPE